MVFPEGYTKTTEGKIDRGGGPVLVSKTRKFQEVMVNSQDILGKIVIDDISLATLLVYNSP